MTIAEHCTRLGWSQTDLVRKANLSAKTVRKAFNGESISNRSVVAICKAFSQELGQRILPADLDGVVISDY